MKPGLKTLLIICIASALVLVIALYMRPISVWAQTEGTETGADAVAGDEGTSTGEGEGSEGDEGPAFSNPAQAQHAANLAEAAAAETDAALEKALDNLDQAEQALNDAIESGDQNAIDAAQKAYDEAKETAEALAAQAMGVTVGDIAAMRTEGMGWGQIAHALGVHPSVLGLGHTKGKKGLAGTDETGDEMREATARDTKSGLAKGHGLGQGSGKGAAGGKGASGKVDKGGKGSGHSGGKGGKK